VGECTDNGAFNTNGWNVQGGQVNMAGATLFVDFFRTPASTNDWIDPNYNCVSGFDIMAFPPLEQLATDFLGTPITTWWAFNYRSVGSVNGFNEFVDNQLCGTIPTDPPSEVGLFNRYEYAVDGVAQIVGANPSGTPFEQCEIEGAFLDVFGSWGVNATGDPVWNNTPKAPGYGLSPFDSSTGYSNQLKSLERDCSTQGLNFNTDDPDGDTLFSLGAAWVPVAVIANRGTGLENIKYSDAYHLWTTGRMPNGENLAAACRDVGSGTRNAAMNSIGIDVSYGRGDNRGDKQKSGDTDVLGWHPDYHQAAMRGGSSRMEGTIQNRRLAVGYTGISGSSRAAKDATDGKYEILDVWKDSECLVPDSYVRPNIDTILDNCDPCTGYQIAGTGSFVVRGNIDTNRDPGMECGQYECVGGSNPGDPCTSHADCLDGGECLNTGSGDPCTDDGHCTAPETCLDILRCDGCGDRCFVDDDCDVDETCLAYGDPNWLAPVHPEEPVDNQAVADYLINIFDSIAAFEGDVEAEESNNMPGQQLATLFFLPAGIDCLHAEGDGTAYGPGDLNEVLQEFIRTHHPMSIGGSYPTPDFGSANPANQVPVRREGGPRGERGVYSDGSTQHYIYYNGTYTDIAENLDLSKRNRIAGDFGSETAGVADFERDLDDIPEMVKAVYKPRTWQRSAVATGSGTGDDLGDMSADNAIPEVLGDYNGDGDLDKEDVRYFMDGLAVTPGRGDLDRKQGAIDIDAALVAEGQPYPWADTRKTLVIPGTYTPPTATDPTFKTPRSIADFHKTGKGYDNGDFRCDVAGRLGPCECPEDATVCMLWTCSVSGDACDTDYDCEWWNGETCVNSGSGDSCEIDDDCVGGEVCAHPRCDCETGTCTEGECTPIETFPTPGAEPTGWDGTVDDKDIDYVCQNLGYDWATVEDAVYVDMSCDMDGNLAVEYADVVEMVTGCLGTQIGDANLDGQVDSTDEGIVTAHLGQAGGWADGDFDCDGMVTQCDLAALHGVAYSLGTVESCRSHGAAGRLCIDMADGATEPRLGGIVDLDVTLNTVADYTLTAGDVEVDNVAWSGTVAVSGPVGNTYTLTFSPALTDATVTTIMLPCLDSFCVRGLEGDIDRGGLVSTSDASIIKPKFGDTPTGGDAEFDYDVSGLISTSDFSQVKPNFGHAVAECP
jgi:hypothetical protein